MIRNITIGATSALILNDYKYSECSIWSRSSYDIGTDYRNQFKEVGFNCYKASYAGYEYYINEQQYRTFTNDMFYEIVKYLFDLSNKGG